MFPVIREVVVAGSYDKGIRHIASRRQKIGFDGERQALRNLRDSPQLATKRIDRSERAKIAVAVSPRKTEAPGRGLTPMITKL